MKKIILFLVLTFICSITVKAQKFTVRQLPDLVAFNGEGKYAIIIILTHDSYKLSFSTPQDGPDGSLIENIDRRQIGNQVEHTLTFECKAANGSLLRIDCPGYNRLELPIKLSPNEAIKYYIEDPEDPETKACSDKYRLLGEKYLRASNSEHSDFSAYERSKEAFEESLKCWTITSESDSAMLNKRIRNIDSLIYYIQEAESGRYNNKKIYDYYEAAYQINPDDENITRKRREFNQKYRQECQEYRRDAEQLLKEKKDVKETNAVLEKIIDLGCSDTDSDWAKGGLREVERWKNTFSRHTLTYEYEKGTSLGISTGNYNIDNSSGYFTLRMNPNIFDAFRMKDADTLQTELNVSFGWTIPIFHWDLKSSSNVGLWLFFGPGATMLANIGQKYTTVEEEEEEESTQEPNDSRYKYHFALSPEAGLLLKIPIPGSQRRQLALRYTYQYRYAIEKDDVDLIGKTKQVLGIGFTF
ncbi:MAG: hypothetical protein LBR97_02420 [Dysgonamonadaceae bacterium]|jgi:hypothetical protein|nr:hypothetical protein [Dysgonamonadaceae bacterium]